MDKKIEAQEEYTKPELREYGDLRELTAGFQSGTNTDVATGAPAPFVFAAGQVSNSPPFGGRL